MLEKRHYNYPVIIEYGYHCLLRARFKKIMNQHIKMSMIESSSKQATIVTTLKSEKKISSITKKK